MNFTQTYFLKSYAVKGCKYIDFLGVFFICVYDTRYIILPLAIILIQLCSWVNFAQSTIEIHGTQMHGFFSLQEDKCLRLRN